MRRLGMALFGVLVAAAAYAAPVRRLVLEEQRIEGKIRRPQLVLIRADQRPRFESIVAHSALAQEDITRAVDPSVIEACPYDAPFRFSGTRIRNIVP